jgi:hypothetical protein
MTAQANNSFILYLFYSKFDPKTYQKLGSPHEVDGLKFENLTYYNDSCPLRGTSTLNETVVPNTVYVDKPDCPLPKNAEIINVIRTSDGLPAMNVIKLDVPQVETSKNQVNK